MALWKKQWNRLCDTYYGDEGKRENLLKIELSLFEFIREEIEQEAGPWNGSKHMNSKADAKIAENIYNSLRSYEKGRYHSNKRAHVKFYFYGVGELAQNRVFFSFLFASTLVHFDRVIVCVLQCA